MSMGMSVELCLVMTAAGMEARTITKKLDVLKRRRTVAPAVLKDFLTHLARNVGVKRHEVCHECEQACGCVAACEHDIEELVADDFGICAEHYYE